MSSRLKLTGLREEDGRRVRFQHYVTLDWDSHPELLREALTDLIRKHEAISRAWVRPSSHKANGSHLVLELDKAYDTWVLFFLRQWLGDDPSRLEWDRSRKDPQGVLFDYKLGQFSGDWKRFK